MGIGRKISALLFAAVALSLMASCSVTRRIPDGSYMLKRNVIQIDKDTPRRDRITSGELNRYVQQSTNRHFLGTNLYAWLYAQADPEKNNGGNRFLRRLGEEPVVWDPQKTTLSVGYLDTYIASRGFFSGGVTATVDTLKRKKVRVRYKVRQGEPSYLGNIRYVFRDTTLRELVMADSAATLLHEGDIFNVSTMDAERQRITTNLKNRGYYGFDVGSISYVADSMNRNRLVDLTLIVRRHLDGYGPDGSPVYSNHRVSRLNKIYVRPDYDPLGATSGDQIDTISTRGINIVYDGKQNVRSRVLRRAIFLDQGGLYSAAGAARTSSELMRLGAFRSASVLFNPAAPPATIPGATGLGTSGGQVDWLDCDIRGVPGLRHGIRLDLEGTTSSSFYGLRTTLGYQNRNIFRGAELFDASVTAGFEFLKGGKRKLSYELGASVSLSFPRFVFWEVDRKRKARAPMSTLTLSANWQDRAYYSRMLFGLSWGYSWGIRRFENFTLRPIDVSVIDMRYIDPVFTAQLRNPYLQAAYADQLIAGISASYVYNNQPRDLNAGAIVFRLNVETTGNLISGVVRLVDKPQPGGYYNILGLRFSQYVRGEASFSQKIVIGEKTSIAYRLYAGAILPYLNSSSPPFEKLFYAGGANSMRGWTVRTLGPGEQRYRRQNYPAQMGDMKLEVNFELRFPIFKMVNGAVFADAGNIWFMRPKPGEYPEDAVFRFGKFYKQLGFNTGVGLRVDVKFVVLRLDWGIQLHSPNRAPDRRWIYNFKWANTALNFGVGYPF